jgi:hypothetical protein
LVARFIAARPDVPRAFEEEVTSLEDHLSPTWSLHHQELTNDIFTSTPPASEIFLPECQKPHFGVADFNDAGLDIRKYQSVQEVPSGSGSTRASMGMPALAKVLSTELGLLNEPEMSTHISRDVIEFTALTDDLWVDCTLDC